MRKMKLLIFLCVMIIVTLCGCGSKETVLTTEKEPITESSTGVPSGQIEQPQIFYNGNLYKYYATGRDQKLPEGFEKVATIEVVDMTKVPTEHLYATGVDLSMGQAIYASETNDSKIYVEYDTGFAAFRTEK